MKILIVEDEAELRKSIQAYLEADNFQVEYAGTVAGALIKIFDYSYDCILLDLNLPDGNGLDILKNLKDNKIITPVIILSARDSVDDKVKGLDMGADDYIAKPFHLSELEARIKSQIRRHTNQGNAWLTYENIKIDLDERKVLIDDSELRLNRKEFDLLFYLMSRPGKTFQKTTLAESIWGDYIDQSDRYDFIYSQVKNLRKKLKAQGAKADIAAVYGIGYKFV